MAANDKGAPTSEIEQLRHQLALAEQRNAQLEQIANAGAPLPPEHQTAYEILSEGYYSPDDVLYPIGSQFIDITGAIIPNEHMIPLNAPAEKRMTEWLNSLPTQDKTPPIEHIIAAATQLRNFEGDQKEFQKAMLDLALNNAFHGQDRKIAPKPVTMPARPGNVPLMSNTRIMGQAPSRTAHATSLHREAIAPADKSTPVVGSRADLLGGVSRGVIAR